MKSTRPLAGLVLLAASAIAVPAPSQASEPVSQAPSCGEWVAHREKSSTLALSYTGWLRGYLAGMGAGAGKDYLAGTENSTIYKWMDNYCRSNPLRDVGSGAKLLAAELAGKRAAPK